MSIFYLVLAIAIWGVVHSALASISLKEFFRRSLGAGFMRFYRLGYNLFAVLSFLPVLYLMLILPDRNLYSVSPPWSLFMRAGQVAAALLLLAALLQTDMLSFAGLRQLFEEEKPGALVTRGLYRLVRHPLYTFSLLVIWLSPAVSSNSFVVYTAATIYTLTGVYFEERKLLREFGQSYVDYKRVTPMLVPGAPVRRQANKQTRNTL